MFIRNGKRFNIYPKFTDPDTGEGGIDLTRLENRVKYGIEEIADPNRESDETHYNQEIDEAPYIISTPKSAEQLAITRWENIKNKRDFIIDNGGCLVSGKWFHTDAKSKQQQMALLILGSNIPANLQWKTMDGSFIEMTQSLVAQLFAAQVTREQAIFTLAETKNTDSSDVNTGWPDIYTENV